MLKINLKKFLSLFLVIVLVTAQVFTAFAHEADAESSEQNVNPQVNEEVLDDAHERGEELGEEKETMDDKEEEYGEEDELSDVARSAAEGTEAETEFVGEELDEEETEETVEVEEPENPDDLVNEDETTEETNDESDKEVKDEDNVAEEADKEDDEEDERSDVARSAAENDKEVKDETEIEIVEEETSEQKETETTEQTEETTEDDEIEVEIVDGEVIEKTEAETETTQETESTETEVELETLEEIAETVETKLAQAGTEPEVDWTNFPDAVCDDAFTIRIIPNGVEVTSVTYDGVDQPIPPDPADREVNFTCNINPDPNGPITIVVTNANLESTTVEFPQKIPHDFYYYNSDPVDDYGTRIITALCHRHGGDCGTAQFTTTEGISEVWDEAGITPFADPDYQYWQPDPLVVTYTNNFSVGKADDPVEANRPTCTLTDSTGTETFAIAYFTITKNYTPMNPPTGLVAVETSTVGSKDGKIEGLVPGEMEWATEKNQVPYITATTTVLENLEPRIYYVRFKETESHTVSQAAEIEVPRGKKPDPKPPSPGGGGSGGGGGGGGGASRGGAMPSFINIIPYAPIGADPAAGKYSLFYDAVVGAYKATPTVNTIARSPEDSAKPLETGAIDTTKESNQAEDFASGWALVQDVAGQSDNWYYFDPATKFMKTGWVQDNGYLYFTHNKDDSLRGRIYSGWHDVDGQVCYFDETNYCLTAVISKVDALTRGIVTVEDSAAAVTLGNLDLKPTVGSQGLATITFADQTSIRPGEQNANNAPTLLTVTSSTDLAESRKEFLDSLAALGMIQQ